jgi:hypothetical protein
MRNANFNKKQPIKQKNSLKSFQNAFMDVLSSPLGDALYAKKRFAFGWKKS